jgi:hypothetical protein
MVYPALADMITLDYHIDIYFSTGRHRVDGKDRALTQAGRAAAR